MQNEVQSNVRICFDSSLDFSPKDSTKDIASLEYRFVQPTTKGPLKLIAAGAPEKLFGAENAPTFSEAFQTLSTAGFDAFSPFFARTEIDEQNEVSDILNISCPPRLVGRTIVLIRIHMENSRLFFPHFLF